MIAPATTDARVLALVQSYRAAEYRWQVEGRWHPLVVGEVATELEAAYPQARSFGMLAAWNPHSVRRPETDNRAADEALQAALQAAGVGYCPGFASARNRSWREPSWVVMDLATDAFDSLARRFGQLGALYARRGEPLHLRVYARRPKQDAELGGVDWVE